jgi:hypothetical protein
MVLVYNSRSVKSIDESIKQTIIDAGVPISVYENCFTDLGPSNKSALKRFVNICSIISQKKLPLPPSPFIEFIVDRTTGKSKQDFTGSVDGKKGMGKSYTGGYECGRYAIEVSDRWGQDPKDYFSLNNCALLEDTEGITKILDEAEKYQAIMIDDAGVAVSSRDFATQKNKNLNKIMTVCRTKRWFVMQNAPMSSHIDLQQRELMDMIGHIYKSFHEDGFNIVKFNSSNSIYRFGKKRVFEKRFSFFDRKIDFYCAFSPDILDPFAGFTDKYDIQRETAANKLISDITVSEKSRNNPITNREKKRQENIERYGEKIRKMVSCGDSNRSICRATGLTDHMVNRIVSELSLK